MVDFEGRDVEGGDFEGIKTMLKQVGIFLLSKL